MVDMREVEEEIEKLENCGATTYSVCEKLSVLYSVKDHAVEPERPRLQPKLQHYEREKSYAGSEFALAALKVPQEELVEILDDHMEAIRQLYPREYTHILKRIKARE